jgi:rfaE bifunctional protein nucleotidyltransferase chain/domain
MKLAELRKALVHVRKYLGTIVFTNGCFDILHAGHVDYLEKAKQLGTVLVVGVNCDRSVRNLKGPARPYTPMDERCRIIAALACVDYVTIFFQNTPMKLIEHLRPHIIVKGDDWKEDGVAGAKFIKDYGGKVILVEQVFSVHTTALIERIKGEKP